MPEGVTQIMVEMWGAGGAFGGSGGYIRDVETVMPGETINIVVGAPGTIVLDENGDGVDLPGGDTVITFPGLPPSFPGLTLTAGGERGCTDGGAGGIVSPYGFGSYQGNNGTLMPLQTGLVQAIVFLLHFRQIPHIVALTPILAT